MRASKPSAVLLFSTQLLKTGGIESHIKEFCDNLGQAGVVIDLVVLNSSVTEETESFYQNRCRRVFLCKKGRSISRIFWLLITIIKLAPRRYKALYTNGQGSSIGILSSLIRKEKWIHHHHTSGDREDQVTWSGNYVRSLKSADVLIACSKRNANDIQMALERDVEVINCFSRNINVKRSEELDLPKNIVRFGYFGRLIPEKGIDHLCRLSEEKELKGVEFHIWGEGEGYPAAFFKKYPNVRYNGTFRTKDELSTVLGSIDGFLLLSVHPEGLPISLLEVMSAGIPWLSTKRGGIPDIALDRISTRVLEASPDYGKIKSAVLDFYEDLSLGRISRKNQIEYYNKYFAADVLLGQWLIVLGIDLKTKL